MTRRQAEIPVDEPPSLFVAVQETVVVAIGKVKPDGGVHTTLAF